MSIDGQRRSPWIFGCLALLCTAALACARCPEAQQPNAGRPAGSMFRDCAGCPEMVVIPGGKFTMGSPPEEKAWAVAHGASVASVSDEAPQNSVSLRSFALGKYDVTRAEYAAFVRATGHPAPRHCHESGDPHSRIIADATWENPGFTQTDRDPVVCVSSHDAHAYISWLNDAIRQLTSVVPVYRLPSESEWEYSARAGTTTRFWWGDDDSAADNYAWYATNADKRTHPVGLKPPNSFGLYDMAGNVWQWPETCYAEAYADSSTDWSACLRSDRGGSWFYPAWLLRCATRERNPPEYRDGVMGFRVARSL
jgi:formylglycine-generating enzyme required for sulfatase activity